MTDTPDISCIMALSDGPQAAATALSIRSLMHQSHGHFELILVDHGASETTRAVLRGFDDARIVHVPMADDGQCTARNRGLSVARGGYVCFLDPGDTRPPWALADMARHMADAPDCIFAPGLHRREDGAVGHGGDLRHFQALRAAGLAHPAAATGMTTVDTLYHLACLDRHVAGKLVRRDFLQAHGLCFPGGLGQGDILFHHAILMNLRRHALATQPGHVLATPQPAPGRARFDYISVTGDLLELFARSQHFQDGVLRLLVLASVARMLQDGATSLSHEYSSDYRHAVQMVLARIDPRYANPLKPAQHKLALSHAPWVAGALLYLQRLRGQGSQQAPS